MRGREEPGMLPALGRTKLSFADMQKTPREVDLKERQVYFQAREGASAERHRTDGW